MEKQESLGKKYEDARSNVAAEIELTSLIQTKSSFIFHTIGLSILLIATELLYNSLTFPLVIIWVGLTINFRLLELKFHSQKVACYTNSYLAELVELNKS